MGMSLAKMHSKTAAMAISVVRTQMHEMNHTQGRLEAKATINTT
jgi:hypothetical protein